MVGESVFILYPDENRISITFTENQNSYFSVTTYKAQKDLDVFIAPYYKNYSKFFYYLKGKKEEIFNKEEFLNLVK